MGTAQGAGVEANVKATLKLAAESGSAEEKSRVGQNSCRRVCSEDYQHTRPDDRKHG